MDVELKRRFDRIDEKITFLLQAKIEQTWVTAYFVRLLTGWDDKALRQAREQGVVECKRVRGSVKYLVQSIPQVFLIRQQVNVHQ